MSNIASEQQQKKYIMRFNKQVEREEFVDRKWIDNYFEFLWQIETYDCILDIFDLVDFNTKGLFQNIIYLKMLTKKGLFKVSIDIYLEHIVKYLLYNYKVQIINEFALINQHISLPEYCKYSNDFLFYKKGVDFAIDLYNCYKSCNKYLETYNYNLQQKKDIEGNDFDDIYNKLTLEEKQKFTSTAIVFKDFGCLSYYIDKICNKIIKVRERDNPDYKRQFKKADITRITLRIGEIRTYPYSFCENINNLHIKLIHNTSQIQKVNDLFKFKDIQTKEEFNKWTKEKKDMLYLTDLYQNFQI